MVRTKLVLGLFQTQCTAGEGNQGLTQKRGSGEIWPQRAHQSMGTRDPFLSPEPFGHFHLKTVTETVTFFPDLFSKMKDKEK